MLSCGFLVLAQIQLTPVDYAAIVAYALVIILIGAWFARDQRTSTDYLLAGRSMGWIVVAISQLASLLSAISYLGNPGEAYAYDLSLLLYNICGFLAVPIVIYLFLNFFYRLQIASIYEYLERRFNYPTRALASVIFIAARLAWMATIVTAISLVMETLTGLEPSACIIATTVIATIYTLVGGMKTIIWTDVVQFFLFVAGLAGAVLLIVRKDGSGELVQVVFNADKLRMFHFSLDPAARITVWACITAGVINGVANLTDQVSMQRYLSCKSLRDAQKAVWLKPLLTIPVTILTFLLGLALFAHYQLNPALAEGFDRPDKAFPHFILNEMTGGLAGIIIAAIFAAAMSSIDSGIHTISTVCVEDYYKRLINPDATDRRCLWLARALTLLWAIVIVVVALVFAGRSTIVEMAFAVSAPFFGCAVGIFLLGTSTRRAVSAGVFCGALIGYGLVLWAKFGVFRVSGTWTFAPWLLEENVRETADQVSKFWLPFVSFAGTVFFGYLISLLFPASPPEKLHGLNIWDQGDESTRHGH